MTRFHITWACSALLASGLAFIMGWQVQKMRGYHYELRSEKRVPYGEGTVAIKYVTESMGLPFLDPGTSIVTLESGSGSEITIYKARRVFQEASPFVDDVKVTGDVIEWSDGRKQYHLRISALEGGRDSQPN
jgi:hypothetical protein